MTEALRLHDLLPDYYEGNVEMDALTSAEQPLIDKLFSSISLALDNQFVPTADSNTLSLYEKMLKLPIYEDDTLEQRRFRILSKIGNKKNYTIRTVKEMISELFNNDMTIEEIFNEYRVIIDSHLEMKGQLEQLDYLVKTVIPANLITDVNNELIFSSPRKTAYLGAAMVPTELVMITNDAVFNPVERINPKFGLTTIPTFLGTLSNDINAQVDSKTQSNLPSAIVNTEEVIIR